MGLTAGSMALKAYGAYRSAKAQKSAYQANAQIDQFQESQAILNGQTNVQTSELQTAQVKGAQRAALGANGVDLGYGSATDVLASTDLLGDRDKATIMDNALRTAWGYKVQGSQNKSAAGQINPSEAAVTSLLGSATTTAGSAALTTAGAWAKQQYNGAMAVVGS